METNDNYTYSRDFMRGYIRGLQKGYVMASKGETDDEFLMQMMEQTPTPHITLPAPTVEPLSVPTTGEIGIVREVVKSPTPEILGPDGAKEAWFVFDPVSTVEFSDIPRMNDEQVRNRNHRAALGERPGPLFRETPNGHREKLCSGCYYWKSTDKGFYKSSTLVGGLSHFCKLCTGLKTPAERIDGRKAKYDALGKREIVPILRASNNMTSTKPRPEKSWKKVCDNCHESKNFGHFRSLRPGLRAPVCITCERAIESKSKRALEATMRENAGSTA